jgi:tripartite-type tricarboxylate transporter receptor subunit TctC
MMLNRRSFIGVGTSGLTSLACGQDLWAQTYPTRPVHVIVASAAGGPPDMITRIVMQHLSESLGQPFIIENIPTGAGNVGAATAAKAPADGYTILAPTSSFVVNPGLYAKLRYDPIRDFTPVTLVAVAQQVIVVHPSLPANTLAEFIALVKANPGRYSYASPGTGTTGELAAELLKLSFGLDLVRVPFNGGAPAIASTVAGHTPVSFVALPSAAANIKEGKLRALVMTGSHRAPEFPDVPILAEAGIPDQESYFWQCVLVPAGTPQDIVDLLYREIARTVARQDVKDRLAEIGFEPVATPPTVFAGQLKTEIARWSKVIRDADIKKIE